MAPPWDVNEVALDDNPGFEVNEVSQDSAGDDFACLPDVVDWWPCAIRLLGITGGGVGIGEDIMIAGGGVDIEI